MRERCARVLALADEGRLRHWRVERARLDAAVSRVTGSIDRRYRDPDRIPYHSRWRHFEVDGEDLALPLFGPAGGLDADEAARARIDLATVSVLLDAGAGPAWRYVHPASGRTYSRSEGLAIASLDLFASGAFSSRPDRPLQADADGLAAVDARRLAAALQVSVSNPLAGLEGRAGLLQRLGRALRAHPRVYGEALPRPGGLLDHLRRGGGAAIAAEHVLSLLLDTLGAIWPGRIRLGGLALGDTWALPGLGDGAPGSDLVPFHKLSQWLCYSLLEPLESAGLTVNGLGALTGLAEYRNGGLLVDSGLLSLTDPADAGRTHSPSEALVVEWRALTVALIDEIAAAVRKHYGLDEARMPLAKVLEGGTWAAGRALARERRPGGPPPVSIESDGTVF